MVFGRFFLPDSYSIITRKAGVLGQITICTGSNWYWWWWCWWWWRRWWRKSPVEPITNVATWKLLSHGKAPGIEGWAKHNHHLCDIHCCSFCLYLKIWLQVKVTCATNQCPGQTLLQNSLTLVWSYWLKIWLVEPAWLWESLFWHWLLGIDHLLISWSAHQLIISIISTVGAL